MTTETRAALDDAAIGTLRERTRAFMDEHIYPNEEALGAGDVAATELLRDLQARVKDLGMWAPHLPAEAGGMGIGFMPYVYMNELLGRSPYAPRAFGAQAPDSGNAEILWQFGTPEQRERWMKPLVAGDITSCFSMTEPEVSGADPTNLQTRAVRDGDEWVINGRKWFTSGARRAAFAIVMCRTQEDDGEGGARDRMTQIIVPTDAPGFTIVRSVPVWGHDGDHCEIVYDNVRVPVTNQLGRTGSGHQAAQDRLGAGRVFHCMNSIGQMWRAFDLMLKRVMTRDVHGGPMRDKQFVQGFIADSYIDIQAARLMTIHCAERIDAGADARADISAIKIAVPAAFERVVDRAIQVYGAKGVSGDTPLEAMYRGARTLRILDGPDEVHRIVIAKRVLACYRDGMSWDFGA